MKTWQVPPVRKKERKPILYWEAEQCGKVIDFNNSIAILRDKLKGLQGVIFKAIR